MQVCTVRNKLPSQQHASVSQGRICSDNFKCCHTEIEAAIQTFHLTQPQYTDTGPTSPSADPITPGAWQGSHWSANVLVTGITLPGKFPKAQTGMEPRIFRSRGGRLTTQAVNELEAETNRPWQPKVPLAMSARAPPPSLPHVSLLRPPSHSTRHDRAEVLRGLRHHLNQDRPKHLSVGRLEERGLKKGSGRCLPADPCSTRPLVPFRARLLTDGPKYIRVFTNFTIPYWAESETEISI